jgi:hypothetical protein
VTPHLLHIGYAKAGSTILQRWFRTHPQIAFAREGVLGLRTVYDISKAAVAEPRPALLRVTSEESLATPHRSAGEGRADHGSAEHFPQSGAGRVCSHLADLFPDAWILIVTRGFRDIMVSSYSQYLRRGGTGAFFGLDPEFGSASHRSRAVWDYDGVIRQYQAAFPGRVMVLPYELLRDDPAAFLGVIEGAFGLDPLPLPARVDNPSFSPVELAWYARFNSLAHAIPAPVRVKRRLVDAHLKALDQGRWSKVADLCQKLRPRQEIAAQVISASVIERFAPKAEILRSNPVYRPYAADYLL